MATTSDTLYQLADSEIRRCIGSYLSLVKATDGLSKVTANDLTDSRSRVILLAGLGVSDVSLSPKDAVDEWLRRRAIPFDIEAGITYGVYERIRALSGELFDAVDADTSHFRTFDSEYIHTHPWTLPILQRLAGVFSKSALKRSVGSASDTSISRPVSERLAQLLAIRVDPSTVKRGEVLQRLEATLEGIVRDLVGRVLLESVVDSALRDPNPPLGDGF